VEYHCLERQIQDSKLQSSIDKFFSLENEESGITNTKLIKSLKKIEDVINEAHQILDKLNLSSTSNGNGRQTMVANPPTTTISPQKVFGQ